MPQRAQQRLAGAIAGLLATMPTTAVMTVSECCLLRPGQNSLAPGQTTQNALRALDLNGELSREEEVAWLVVNHFGFDASTGALYGSLCKPRPVADALAPECIHGSGVSSCSYLGWLRASGLYRSGVNDTPERNTPTIITHLVWGRGLRFGNTLYFQ